MFDFIRALTTLYQLHYLRNAGQNETTTMYNKFKNTVTVYSAEYTTVPQAFFKTHLMGVVSNSLHGQ
jgi:hypothetical protein